MQLSSLRTIAGTGVIHLQRCRHVSQHLAKAAGSCRKFQRSKNKHMGRQVGIETKLKTSSQLFCKAGLTMLKISRRTQLSYYYYDPFIWS